MTYTFTQQLEKSHWDKISTQIYQQTEIDVKRALKLESLGLKEMLALLSPAALNYLEPLAQRAQQLTRRRFGNIVNFYLPLYLSNFCSNECTYCGFSISNRIQRTLLNENEIVDECHAIRDKGISNILLVTGEHVNKVGMHYFRRCILRIRSMFSSLLMEVQPLSQSEYTELIGLGLDGVLVYQETYDPIVYRKHHIRGKKTDFVWRLETPDRLARAKIDKIGLGILIGLSNNWRTDCYMLAQHLMYMRSTYWQSRYSLSFPRLRPYTGGTIHSSIMNEAELLQVMCAFRLLVPEAEITLSTRESARFRDHVIPIVVNSVSAGSKTYPGGYTTSNRNELEQFLTDDNRSPQELAESISLSGLQPIWKDWDFYLGRTK